MSNDDFDALIRLIETLISLHGESSGNERDGPRQARIERQRNELIEEMRERLVL